MKMRFLKILQIFSKVLIKFEEKMRTALEMNAVFGKSMSKNVGVWGSPADFFLNGDLIEWGFN